MTRTTDALSRAGRTVLDLLVPPCCGGCGAALAGGILCETCAPLIEPITSPRCPRCGIPYEGEGRDHPCGACILRPPSFNSTTATFVYEGPLADGVRALKYGPRPERAETLARLWRDTCGPLPPVDLVVPVPLHARKLRSRGFDQTVVLSGPLLRSRGLRLDPRPLRRVLVGTPQASLSLGERRKAPRGLYEVPKRAVRRVEGRRALLVDDVMTTGATLSECARLLRRAGAAEVHALVLARAIVGR